MIDGIKLLLAKNSWVWVLWLCLYYSVLNYQSLGVLDLKIEFYLKYCVKNKFLNKLFFKDSDSTILIFGAIYTIILFFVALLYSIITVACYCLDIEIFSLKFTFYFFPVIYVYIPFIFMVYLDIFQRDDYYKRKKRK